ncbi:polyketide synthase [Adonisia turfae]|uniref:Enoyl-CoA hydratase n=2 Tax=Cyanobacteriota TaxID=1117 RepID=A0A6M0RPX4_9CYAN|nr:polyketide synthase [Adonisia turfae]AMH40437.1 enoyl-CoA hydratase [Leptolyngbya sp. ISBN3-Nov-94-8]NEZ57812.1 enoyl-CoA hydratase [Adonisia turfae CCMR0081]
MGGMSTVSESVVNVKEVEPYIVQVTMCDRVHKNTFTHQMSRELILAFQSIATNNTFKAVILTGFDSYFASGGTQEDLLTLQEGNGKFSDNNIYGLALDCRIPVISAMQGHGIGGGFVMGLFADFVILSRESIYTTNFMKYGFTPGMGATMIVPHKLGPVLGPEMLLQARRYRGAELKERGAVFPVYPRTEVMKQALDVARDLARIPRVSLITLKDHLVQQLRKDLPRFIEQEVTMHGITFHQQEVRDNIRSLFGK